MTDSDFRKKYFFQEKKEEIVISCFAHSGTAYEMFLNSSQICMSVKILIIGFTSN